MAGSTAFKSYLMLIPKLEDGATAKIQSSLSGTLSSAAKVGGAAVAAGAVAATTALVAVGKAALDAYADYEQLVGGVDTLFKESSATVQEYAANAYKTAGLSANDYLETVTSFSASLLQSLGGDTAKAAQYADTAITDMSDNANKMGSDISSLQDAYQGFAKQNYTMLDNLKLGYGGTKSEMERLIADANALREAQGLNADLTIDSYADIVEAIHTVQTEMGITGTTALEASTTIEGSVNSAKAAYQNWITALGDDSADIEKVTRQLVDSVSTAASNILPRLQIIFQALITELPSVVMQLSPVLVDALMQLIPAIVALVPQFLEAAMQLFTQLLSALTQVAPQLVAMLPELVMQLASTLIENLPVLLEGGLTLFLALATAFLEALPQIIAMLPQLIEQAVPTLISMIPTLLAAGVTLFLAIAQAVPQILGALLSAIGSLIKSGIGHVGDFIGDMADAGWQLIQGLIEGITSAPSAVVSAVTGIVGDAISAAKSLLGIASPSKVFKAIGQYTMEGFEEGLKDMAARPEIAVRKATSSVISAGADGGYGRTATYNITMNVTADSTTTLESLIRQAERAGMAYGR